MDKHNVRLRVENIDRKTSPDQLVELFSRFGKVEEASIHASAEVVYGLVVLAEPGARRALGYEDDEDDELGYPEARKIDARVQLRLRGKSLEVYVANHFPGPWLSPDWNPPTIDPRRGTSRWRARC